MFGSVLVAKTCTKCGQEKPIGGFSFDRTHATGKDGRHPWCRECRSENARQWRLANEERHRQNSCRWYSANKKWHMEQKRRRQRENPERMRQQNRQYYAANLEHCRMYGRLAVARRQARKAGLPDTRSSEEIHRLFSVQEDRCFYCGTAGALTVDHIVPFAAEDAAMAGNVLENVVGACLSCNSSKHAKPVELWLGQSNRPTISLEEFTKKHHQLLVKIGEGNDGY